MPDACFFSGPLPRVHAGKVYNGGTPWSDGFDPQRCIEGIKAGLCHSGFGLNDVISIDYENDHVNTVLAGGGNAEQLAKSLRVYLLAVNGIPGREGPWAFPRHEYLGTIRKNLQEFRRVLDTVDRLHLDAYHWHTHGSLQYARTIRNLSEAVKLFSLRPNDCVWYVRLQREGTDPNQPPIWLTPHELYSDLVTIYSEGGRDVAIWHPGDKWRNPAKDEAFRLSLNRANHTEIRAVFDHFNTPT